MPATIVSDVESHLTRRLAQTPVQTEPFPHFHVTSVFPEEFYRDLQREISKTDGYRKWTEIADIKGEHYGRREQIYLTREWLDSLPAGSREVWQGACDWLLSTNFRNQLLAMMRPHLQRYENAAELPELWSEAILLRHRAHYHIGPHTDIPTKVITLLFYLARDDQAPQLGTSVYAPKQAGMSCDGNRHHTFDGFNRVTTIPYLPNSMFGFVRTDRSFHGVEPIDTETSAHSQRDVIQFSIYDNPGCEPKDGQRR